MRSQDTSTLSVGADGSDSLKSSLMATTMEPSLTLMNITKTSFFLVGVWILSTTDGLTISGWKRIDFNINSLATGSGNNFLKSECRGKKIYSAKRVIPDLLQILVVLSSSLLTSCVGRRRTCFGWY